MLYGMIDKDRYGNYIVRVDGFPKCKFIYYTKREAIKQYRDWHKLQRKRINFLDMCARSYYLENGEYVKC